MAGDHRGLRTATEAGRRPRPAGPLGGPLIGGRAGFGDAGFIRLRVLTLHYRISSSRDDAAIAAGLSAT